MMISRKTPAHQTIARMREIIANPQPDHTPGQRRMAWAVLKTARGQRMIQSRLPRPTGGDAA